MRRTPVLILGGGPAGAAAAIALGRAGARPELIERAPGARDAVCGGFLSWRALEALGRLGIDARALGARPIERVRLLGDGRVVELRLPRPAAGLSRRRLDAALLSAAAPAGAAVTRGRRARVADAERRIVRLDDGEEIAAGALFLATGKHELKGLARRIGGSRQETSVGLRAAVPLDAAARSALAGTIELHLFDGGYGGALLQEDGTANICLSVAQRRLSRAGGIAPLIESLAGEAPGLIERIGPAPPRKWDAVAGVPYGWRATGGLDGLFRTGDQALVSTSLFGDGLAAALLSGIGAAEAFAARGAGAASDWQGDFSRRSAPPLFLGEALRAAAARQGGRVPLMAALRRFPSLGRAAARLTRTRA